MINKLYDGVSRTNDKLESLSALVASRNELIVKQVVNAALLFIILLVFGCLDFATLTFHAEYLGTMSYWGTITTKLIAALCAFNIGINMTLDNEIKKSVELRKNIETYETLIQFKDTDFEYFVNHVYNVKLKIEIYKNQIARKIYLLNRIARRKHRLLYSSELPERQEEKKNDWYCIRRAELEELRSDEYIQKNLDSLAVRFKEVDPAAFELEINGEQKVKGVTVTGSISLGRAKESSTIILTMLAISMLTTSFGLTASAEEFENNMVAFWHYCLKAIEDVGIVLWQFINGLLRARKIVSAQLTKPYAGRIAVLKEYINWREANQKQNSYCFTVLEEEAKKKAESNKQANESQEETIIEVTPEQLAALKGEEKTL